LIIYLFFPSVNLTTFANVLRGGGVGIAKFLICQNWGNEKEITLVLINNDHYFGQILSLLL
jgi:hypothetical protein